MQVRHLLKQKSLPLELVKIFKLLGILLFIEIAFETGWKVLLSDEGYEIPK